MFIGLLTLFNDYDKIQSRVSNLTVFFKGLNEADVNFSHLLVAVEKSSGKKRVLFEGKKTLTLKRFGENWKIVNYH